MAAPNMNKAVIARTGFIKVAPKGTPLPLVRPTAAKPLDAAFVDLGYMNTTGFTLTQTLNSVSTKFWQEDAELTFASGGSWALDFEIAEFNDETLPIILDANKGANGVYKVGTKDPAEVSMYIEFTRGSETRGIVIEDARLTSKGAMNFIATDKTVIPATFGLNNGQEILEGSPFWFFDAA